MNSSHICLACWRRINQFRPDRIFQWQPTASFISLSNTNHRTTTDEKSADDLLHLGDEDSSRKGRYTRLLQEIKRRPPRRANRDQADPLESLFEEARVTPRATPANGLSQPFKALEPYKNAESLQSMLADSTHSLLDSWSFFVEHFGPEAWWKGSIDQKSTPSYLRITARTLLKRLLDEKCNDPVSERLPTVREITKVYFELGMLRGEEWTRMMFALLCHISRRKPDLELSPALETMLVSDLVGSWNIVCRRLAGTHVSPIADLEISSLDWSQVPPLSTKTILQAHQNGGMGGAFGLLLPVFPPSHLRGVPLVALGTFTLLSGKPTAAQEMVKRADPLVSALAHIINVCDFERGQLANAFRAGPAVVTNLVSSSWPEVQKLASRIGGRPITKASTTGSSATTIRKDYGFIYKRLQDAFGQRDAPQVDKLWSDVVRYPIYAEPSVVPEDNAPVSGGQKRGTLSASLCNYFILVYMGLRQPDKAIDVWNHMVTNDLSPNLATWDSMMMGCKAARDWKALEDVWTKMATLRVQPDIVCWTTRIRALIECGRIDSAIRALDEMGRNWLAAAEKKHGKMNAEKMQSLNEVDGAIKPTIETVNAAVGGLLQKQNLEAAHRILAWAARFGISPNVITYNTLLRSMIRQGHSKGAIAVLQQMQTAGIQADAATFTTILDEIIGNADEYTIEEQKETINDVFSEMEAAGVKANLHTYGKLVYRLLQSSKGDLTAVNTVIERMTRQGLQPSTYIYTILVEHYFQQDPADLDAIRSLIERSQLESGSVDHIFWDRVIEGYSRVGDITSAVRILGQVNRGHNKVSWVTLSTLLTALVENEEWDIARSVAKDLVSSSGGPPPEHEHGTNGQHSFWNLVSQLKLLET